MVTKFQITYPQHPGQAFPVAASNGQTLPSRARSDVRPKKGYPVRILTRAEWDDQNKVAGPYLAAYQPKRPVPDVDFEAEDGSLHATAEACLAHELQARFGVGTLAELETKIKNLEELPIDYSQIQGASGVVDGLYDAKGNPPFSGVSEAQPSPAEAARLLASAVSQRGLKIADASSATGLTPAQVRATAASLPAQFEQRGGRVFLVG
jgi:hypothetical protein